jgi:hypothetical protein
MKELNKSDKVAIKRIAGILYNTCVKKMEKIQSKIDELQKELAEQQEAMNKMDTVPYLTNSTYKAFDLVERKETLSRDNNGKEVKVVTYEFKYPDTIYPAMEAPTLTIDEAEAMSQDFLTGEIVEEVNQVEVAQKAIEDAQDVQLQAEHFAPMAQVETPDEATEVPTVGEDTTASTEESYNPFM